MFDLLESILHGIVTQETEQEIYEEKRRRTEREDTSTMISNKIVDGMSFVNAYFYVVNIYIKYYFQINLQGAWIVSQGIIRGAQKAGELMNRGTPKLIDNMTPADQPTEVPRSVSKGVRIAEKATSKAVKVTGFVGKYSNYRNIRISRKRRNFSFMLFK